VIRKEKMEGQAAVTVVEDKWVQCDTCAKWRKRPQEVDLDSMPEVWTCEQNIYDPDRNDCSKEEEVQADPAAAAAAATTTAPEAAAGEKRKAEEEGGEEKAGKKAAVAEEAEEEEDEEGDD